MVTYPEMPPIRRGTRINEINNKALFNIDIINLQGNYKQGRQGAFCFF